MIIDKEHITSVIPQRAPFIMVDALLQCSDRSSLTSFYIAPKNLFVEQGCFHAPGLLENIAQTAAAGAGYRALLEAKPVSIGFIGAIKNFEIFKLPKIGETLITQVDVTHEIEMATVAKGNIQVGDAVIANCELKIFILNEIK